MAARADTKQPRLDHHSLLAQPCCESDTMLLQEGMKMAVNADLVGCETYVTRCHTHDSLPLYLMAIFRATGR